MTILEPTPLRKLRLIPIDQFSTCLIDGRTRAEITKLYPGNGVYYMQKFDRYVQENHGINVKQYCIEYGGVTWPTCPGTGKEVGYRSCSGEGLLIPLYVRGGMRKDNHAGFKASCERLSVERKGEGNPRFGEAPWNKGIKAADDPRVARALAAALAAPFTPERLEKMRQLSLGKAHHNMPHSPETVEKMRIITARRWATGGFNVTNTSIHVKMREFLSALPLAQPFVEEHTEVYYSIDFAFPELKLAIECDGDYFHINPHFYPDGPKDKIQRRNAGRDKAKNTFLGNRGWTVLRYWECDINAGTYKEPLLCKLRELGLLDH